MAAAIDQLLKLVEAQKADALVVASDKVPVLKKAGADVALSMPKVSHDMVSMFVEDLVDALQMKTLIQEGSIKLSHALGELNFAVEIRREGTRLHLGLYLNRGGRPGAAPTAPAPVQAAPPAPPAPRMPAVGGRPPPGRVEAREPALPPLSVGTGSAPATDYRQPGVNLGDLHE